MSVFSNLRTDFSGYCFGKARRNRLKLKKKLCSVFMKVELYFRGVDYQKSNSFSGRALFKRAFDSSIAIGRGNVFLSDSDSNLAGVYRKCTISTLRKGARLTIGNGCGFSGTVIGCAGEVSIGNNVFVGANVFISDFDWHNVEIEKRFDICNSFSAVIIEDNVWIGLNTCVLKGVRIGRNTVIGANSVVTRDIPDNVVAAGNPCKVIKSIKKDNEEIS